MVILTGDFGIIEVVEGFAFPILKWRVSWAFPTRSIGIKAPHKGIHMTVMADFWRDTIQHILRRVIRRV